jgi:soluble lytic murein transglycosylase
MPIARPVLAASVLAAALPAMLGMAEPMLPMTEGRLAYQLGQYERAEALFGEAADAARAKAGASPAEAQLWRGNAAWRQGRSEEALEAWKLAAADPAVVSQAGDALADARGQLEALVRLLDRYGAMRVAGAGGPGAGPNDWRALAREFEKVEAAAGDSLVGRRATLLAADCYGYAGDRDEAVRRFTEGRDRHPLVADWVLWRLAAIDADNAAKHLTELIEHHPGGPIVLDARVALAEATRDPGRKRQILEGVVKEGGRRPAAEKALYLLSQEGGGKPAMLVRYWNAFPEGRYLDDVVRDLAKVPGLSADTNYRIGSYFFFASDYGLASTFFRKVSTPMAQYRLGRSLWGTSELDAAIATLKRVIARDRSLAGKAWLTIGQIEGQRKRWGAAVEAYHKAAAFGGEAGVSARGKIASAYREQGKTAAANQVERSIVKTYPWSEEAANIIWKDFFGAINARRYQDAIVNGRRLAQHNPNHAYGVAAQYWLGRIHERTGQTAQALQVYKGLIGRSPSSYYGWRATFRQRELTGKGFDPWFATKPGRAVEDMPVRYTDLLGRQERELLGGGRGTPLPREMQDWPEAVRELLFLRQFEMADANGLVGRSPNLKAWLSYLQQRYQLAIYEEKGEPRLSYPLGFAPLLINAAQRQKLDPLLLAALVREESRFNPVVKSWVGATGLAQLMPSTAAWVVKQVPDVKGRPLTDPHANLQLGAWYLAYTHRFFDNQSMYAVAAYNGGPGAVARWKRAFRGGDPDEFVESITYNETRLYVKKVFASYWNYQKLYGGGV